MWDAGLERQRPGTDNLREGGLSSYTVWSAMKKLLVATTNPGKVAEYQVLLQGLPLDIVGLREAGIGADVAETGATFEENARIKAQAYASISGRLTLADDSGVCVDALGGAPGVHSARYAQGDRARIERLLSELSEAPDDRRAAHFVCVIALAQPDGEIVTFEGRCEGRIAHQPSGSNGFGFDPIFFVSECGQTMADLSSEVKNRISHRARATAQARAWLMKTCQKTRQVSET